MIIAKLKKIVFQKGTDIVQSFNQFQDGILTILNYIAGIPWLGGNTIKGVQLVGNGQDNVINTGLSYKYSGFWVARIQQAQSFTDVWESDTVNNNTDKVIILKCLGPMKIDLLVF